MITVPPPTAREVLRSLDRLCAQAQYASLATLDEDGRAHVRAMLSQASPRARVDITLLVESVRERISRPQRDAATASIIGRLRAIASRLIETGQTDGDGSEASRVALAMFPAGDPPSRSIPRARSRRALDAVVYPDRVGGRPRGCPTSRRRSQGRGTAVFARVLCGPPPPRAGRPGSALRREHRLRPELFTE